MSRAPKPAQKASATSQRDAEARLAGFLAKFSPGNQKLVRAVRRRMRRRFSTATEMVYDNYNFFVIGYSPTERTSDAVVSITADANGATRAPFPQKAAA